MVSLRGRFSSLHMGGVVESGQKSEVLCLSLLFGVFLGKEMHECFSNHKDL